MRKYQSFIIDDKDIEVETSRYETPEDRRMEQVTVTYLPSGIKASKESSRSQVEAYNAALMELETKVV